MKIPFAIISLATLFIACKKEGKMCCTPPEINLAGKWVDANKREDTLEVYTEGSRGILFDNSAFYRNNQATISDKNTFRVEYKFKDGKIGVRPYSAPSSADYNYFDFTWVEQGTRFTMRQNAIRIYLSSIPVGTYERVQ